MMGAFAFNSFDAELWRDVSARQRQIGRGLRSWYEAVASEALPEHLLDLVHRAERSVHVGRTLRSADRTSSLTIAMMVTGALVALFVLYNLGRFAMTQPALVGGAAFLIAFLGLAAAAIWLVEDDSPQA